MKKGKKYLFILFVTILMFVIFIVSSFEYKGIINVNIHKNKTSFFTCKLFGWNIQGIKQRLKLIGIKIVESLKEELTNPQIFKDKDKKYIVFITQDAVKIYSLNGEMTWEYKVTDDENCIFSNSISDIDNDLTDEILLITGRKGEDYGESLIILTLNQGVQEKFNQSLSELNPWKVQTADIDGDGIKEISISVYKKSKFHPVMAKRPFLYNWNGRDITPKWRGSRLSRPFEDYIFSDIDRDGLDELLSVELLRDGSKVISLYKWTGFGFELIAESDRYPDILDIKKEGDKDRVFVKVKENNDIQWILLGYVRGRLVEKDRRKELIYKMTLEEE